MSHQSDYLIAVIRRDNGQVVTTWEPGLQVEKDFIVELCERVRAKGVGVTKTTNHVVQDVESACRELLHDLKSHVRVHG